MILLGGIPSERPLVLLTEALDSLGAPYRVFNQRRCADCAIATACAQAWPTARSI